MSDQARLNTVAGEGLRTIEVMFNRMVSLALEVQRLSDENAMLSARIAELEKKPIAQPNPEIAHDAEGRN